MNSHEVTRLIEEGEGFHVEFKRRVSSPEKIAKVLIAFANTKGGSIFFGVDDDGSIVGVESEKAEVELIQVAGESFCDPTISPEIQIVPFNGKDVIVAIVAESRTKPHYFQGNESEDLDNTRVYIRVQDKTVTASKEVVKILREENPDAPPLQITIDENERRLFHYLEEYERITLKEFSKLVNISDRQASRILVNLVRAGVLRIHTLEKEDFYTLAFD